MNDYILKYEYLNYINNNVVSYDKLGYIIDFNQFCETKLNDFNNDENLYKSWFSQISTLAETLTDDLLLKNPKAIETIEADKHKKWEITTFLNNKKYEIEPILEVEVFPPRILPNITKLKQWVKISKAFADWVISNRIKPSCAANIHNFKHECLDPIEEILFDGIVKELLDAGIFKHVPTYLPAGIKAGQKTYKPLQPSGYRTDLLNITDTGVSFYYNPKIKEQCVSANSLQPMQNIFNGNVDTVVSGEHNSITKKH